MLDVTPDPKEKLVYPGKKTESASSKAIPALLSCHPFYNFCSVMPQ